MSYLHHLLRGLIERDTVSSRSPIPALEWLADELSGLGFEARLHRYEHAGVAQGNLVAWAGPPEPDGLILSGHVDIVPFADQPGWTRDPLHLELGDDRVHGRGTSDMKGFLAQCLVAARRLDPATLERPLVLVFTGEEEVGCHGAGRLAPELGSLLGELPLPRLCWIGEPTSGRVFHAHKGVVVFRVDVSGEGGHSSVPEAGVNAIGVAARVIDEIGRVQAELRGAPSAEVAKLYPEAPYTTLNLGSIQGGTAANMIAERCSFDVSYRPLPGEDPVALHTRIADRIQGLDPTEPGSDRLARIEVHPPAVAPGLLSARGTSLEKQLRERFGDQQEGGAPFCTDAGQLAPLGIDSIICGPGDLDQAHQPDESISRRALEGGVEDVLSVVRGLCGSAVREREPGS